MEKDKSPETDLSEVGISDLPNSSKKQSSRCSLRSAEQLKHEQSENLNKEREIITKYQTEITELKIR